MNSETSRSLGFGKIKAKVASESDDVKTFSDVAGCDEEKEDLEELVDFLKDPKKFTELGARIPKECFLSVLPEQVKPCLLKQLQAKQVYHSFQFRVRILLKCMSVSVQAV